jgi:hypothetical protein
MRLKIMIFLMLSSCIDHTNIFRETTTQKFNLALKLIAARGAAQAWPVVINGKE